MNHDEETPIVGVDVLTGILENVVHASKTMVHDCMQMLKWLQNTYEENELVQDTGLVGINDRDAQRLLGRIAIMHHALEEILKQTDIDLVKEGRALND